MRSWNDSIVFSKLVTRIKIRFMLTVNTFKNKLCINCHCDFHHPPSKIYMYWFPIQ